MIPADEGRSRAYDKAVWVQQKGDIQTVGLVIII